MSTCATCRFWNRNGELYEVFNEEGDDIELPHQKCLRIIHGNGTRKRIDAAGKEPAFVTDGSGYTAALRTLPTFGCALWEAG